MVGRDFTTCKAGCQEFFQDFHNFFTFIPIPAICEGFVEMLNVYCLNPKNMR